MNVISNVENYDTIFVSPNHVSTTVISRKKNMIDAYQHLPVPIPFISDRHYIFRMSGFEDQSNEISWILMKCEVSQKIDPRHSVAEIRNHPWQLFLALLWSR